jgi:hypothetical protein
MEKRVTQKEKQFPTKDLNAAIGVSRELRVPQECQPAQTRHRPIQSERDVRS